MALWRKRLEADGRFSHLLRIIDDGIDPDAEQTREERFEFGLDCVLHRHRDAGAAQAGAPLTAGAPDSAPLSEPEAQPRPMPSLSTEDRAALGALADQFPLFG